MNINIKLQAESHGFQMFEALYSYRQSLDNQQGLQSCYKSDWNIVVNAPYSDKDLTILFDYMPTELPNLDQFDLVFFCNGGEPLLAATSLMAELLALDKVYLIANSYLEPTHPLFAKVVWFPHNVSSCRDFWSQYFYPQHFENLQRIQRPRTSDIIMINGTNKSWRHHFCNLLTNSCPSIPKISNINANIDKTIDSQWESAEDQVFRDYVNLLYPCSFTNEFETNYVDNSIAIGIDNKFGQLLPGYFIMPEYFDYRCIIFPESSWLNNELAITEKSLKCFYAGSLPFPIGGANINQLYKNLGFSTAWNLLPEELQLFDSILDHDLRYQSAVQAIDWLNQNPQVFQTEYSQQLINQNKLNMLIGNCDLLAVKQLANIILNCYNKA